MAPKKKAAAKKASPKAASSGAGKKAVPETAPTAAASSSPVSSPAKACASPSTAKKTAPAAVAGGKKVRRRRQPLDIVLADNPSPACLSVVASALSADEARLVTARSNGSIAVHRILLHKRAGGSGSSKNRRNKKKAAAATAGEDDTGAAEEAVAVEGPSKRIFNVLMVASTGGRPDAVPTDVLFMGAKDEFVVAAFGSGAFVVYDAVSLAPICSSRRVGGVARSIARSGKLDFFAAVSDGSVRRWQIVRDSKAGSTELRMVQTIPKAVGCERALCVAVDKDLALVVVGDDSRSVTAWELTAVDDLRATTQQWSLQLPNSFPLALALHGNALAIGTSMNEVVFAEPSAGIIVNTFEHHKGPVTTLAAAGGVFYASGWHDSIRAYRANTEESENVAQRQRRRERDAVNNTTAADRAGASDYAPAEVKRRTHYHEVTGICVGVKTGLFISTARDGTILYANLERFFSSPASYVDSQVSVKPHTLAGGDLLFTHRDNSVEVHRVLPHALMPLVNYTLDSSANVRGLWPNTEGTRVCIATDERVTVLSLDVNRDKNTVGIRRLVCSPIPAANAACFSDAETLLVGAGSAVLVLRFDDATVKANTAEGKVAFAKAGAKRVATKTVDEATGEVSTERIKAAASLSCVTQCFSSPALEGTITFMAAPLAETNGHCFVATQQPAAVHWLAMAPSGASIVDVAINEKVDSISHAPLKGKDAGAVSFLNVTDSRHYVATRPGAAGKKIVAVTTAEAPLPLNATIHGRSTILEGPHTNANAPFVASFANGIVDIRSSGDRWNYTRPADRVKAAPNDIKARVEFAAFEPKAAAAPWTSGSAEVAKELEALRKRATKKHRSERATIALDGEASDAEGSDDEAVLEAHIEERKAAEARGESGAVDATFALRRNVPALVQGLPLAWRVRRFGNQAGVRNCGSIPVTAGEDEG